MRGMPVEFLTDDHGTVFAVQHGSQSVYQGPAGGRSRAGGGAWLGHGPVNSPGGAGQDTGARLGADDMAALASRRPLAFTNDLAGALTTLADVLDGLDRAVAAAAARRRAGELGAM